MILPIRTESTSRRTPHVNYLLIGANVVCFLLFDERFTGPAMAGLKERHLVFQSMQPAFHQFITYQFLHADAWHLLGNLLFLWVFGNSVNGKMGDIPYFLFYVSGGTFAAWGHTVVEQQAFQLLGASGAIAAVTTAYLALFPRSRVTVLVWLFFFIRFFEWPATVIIGLKIIVWDNIVAPGIGASGNVAYQAHLAGYLFGFVAALGMLFVRAVPRDQFDVLALLRRWYLRREFSTAMSDPASAARARYGTVARVPPNNAQERAHEEHRLDEVAALRGRIGEALERHDIPTATELYENLVAVDPHQCLSARLQLQIAREFYGSGRFPQAAGAFDRFVECYPHSPEAINVRLLLGIIYARDLRQYEIADKHLTQSLETLLDEERRAQCRRWLCDVRAALGRPL
jgi:membrane associated rhomboid family serine protease